MTLTVERVAVAAEPAPLAALRPAPSPARRRSVLPLGAPLAICVATALLLELAEHPLASSGRRVGHGLGGGVLAAHLDVAVGAGLGGAGARAVAALATAVTALLVAVVGRRIGGDLAGWLSGALVVLSPAVLVACGPGAPDALALAVLAGGLAAATAGGRSRGAARWACPLLGGLLAAVAGLGDPQLLGAVPAVVVAAAISARPERGAPGSLRLLAALAGAGATGAVVLRTDRPLARSLVAAGTPHLASVGLALLLLAPVALLAAAGAVAGPPRGRRQAAAGLFVACAAGAVVEGSVASPAAACAAAAGVVIVAAPFAGRALARSAGRRGRRAVPALVGLVLLLATVAGAGVAALGRTGGAGVGSTAAVARTGSAPARAVGGAP